MLLPFPPLEVAGINYATKLSAVALKKTNYTKILCWANFQAKFHNSLAHSFVVYALEFRNSNHCAPLN